MEEPTQMLQENFNLKDYNTFGLDVSAKYFSLANTTEDLKDFLKTDICKKNPRLILGSGSNILFTENFHGVIIKPNWKGIEIVTNKENNVLVNVQAGVIWDDFVAWAVEQKLGGVENLSYIPGTVGSCPVQNIGAYGQEVKDAIVKVNGFFTDTMETKSFSNAECCFDYRSSIFKTALKDKFIITDVTFVLNPSASANLAYKELGLEIKQYPSASFENIRKAVFEIRDRKLPDPAKIGNAGSFFKNPMVDEGKYHTILMKHTEIPAYKSFKGYKLSAAWLIDQCNWKGYREGDAGIHASQPLVLVNHGNATGQEILRLAKKIQLSVLEKFGILLETEVNIVGT